MINYEKVNSNEFLSINLFADYKLVIRDISSTQIIEECIRSYSFSNNLESIYKENKYFDIYSTNEVLTNKTWIDGKPIYRIVYSGNTPSTDRTYISNFKLTEEAENIRVVETNLYRPDYVAPSGDGIDDNWGYQIIPRLTGNEKGKLYFSLGTLAQSEYLNRPVNVIIEYTKSTDKPGLDNNL